MLHRTVGKLSDGKTYHVFLMGKEPRRFDNPKEILYQVVIRDFRNKDDIYDLKIHLKLAQQLFATPNASLEQINSTLIVFKKNKVAFYQMLECLDIIGEEDFTLDIKKLNEMIAKGESLNVLSHSEVQTKK